jgi:hypothetical protein
MSWVWVNEWKNYLWSWFRIKNLTYKEFVDTLQNTTYSVEYRTEFFYYHYHTFEEELQKNKKDLYYASDLVSNTDEYDRMEEALM